MELRIGAGSVVILLQTLDEIGLREQQVCGRLEAHHGRALLVRRHIAPHTALRPSPDIWILTFIIFGPQAEYTCTDTYSTYHVLTTLCALKDGNYYSYRSPYRDRWREKRLAEEIP